MSETAVARVGEVLEFGFDGSPTTGYRWTMLDDAEGIVELIEDEWDHEGTIVGGPARQVFRLRAQAPGATTLVFRYQRPWEAIVLREESVNITVDESGSTS